jgi:hypothetical protein
MNLFNGNGKVLLLTTSVTVLLCGVVIYFCNMRFQHLEAAVLKQNQVLASFFATMQTDIRLGGGGGNRANNLAAPEAMAAAAQQYDAPPANSAPPKVAVSDNEEEEDTSSSSSEEDDDDDESEYSSDDSASVDDDDQVVVVKNDQPPQSLITSSPADDDFLLTVVDVQISNDVLPTAVNDDDFTVEVQEVQEEAPLTTEQVVEICEVESFNLSDLTVVEAVEPPTTPLKYDAMKVDDLRKIVNDRKLASRDEVKKMKKADLLALLLV